MKRIFYFYFCLLMVLSNNVFAQSKQITIYVPFSAGGSVDIIARMMAAQMSQKMGMPVLVDNKLGAGGNIATALVAQARPNGLILLAHHQGITYSNALSDNLSFNVQKDFAPIATVGVTPNVLVIPSNSQFKNLQEFVEFQSAAGIKLMHIPYKGMPQAIADVAGGQIQAVLTTIPAALPFIQGGSVKALGTSGQKRSSVLPDIPTIQEAGIKNFYYEPWYGFFAPAGTPEADLDKLSAIIVESSTSPEIYKKFTMDGIDVKPLNRQKFTPLFIADIKKWGDVIKGLGLKGSN